MEITEREKATYVRRLLTEKLNIQKAIGTNFKNNIH